ncbi:MAG: anti-anti-sigma factor, partial [Burkholderiaceae bacterium]|nr:anti-anti-sigma factor [Burkholderiaceae bacterium]
MSFALPNCVTQANALGIEKQGALALVKSSQVDCSALRDFDSSVLAVL